ncbi:UNVERIFIED_CONTAM: hypothetical protein FKN15_021247 [Acipenser sinensis]
MDSPVGPEIESKAARVGEMDCLWNLSPDLGLSPVSDLTTPRRKLQLSPELLPLSPTPESNVSPETQTLTGSIFPQDPSEKRSEERSISPKNSMPKPRQCRVKLSSMFTSPTAPKIKWESGGRKSKSPESEERCNQSRKVASQESDPEIHRVPLFRMVQSRQQAPPVEMPDLAAKERNLIGDFSRMSVSTEDRPKPECLSSTFLPGDIQYILKGGYKEFYSQFQSLCKPCGYVLMVHQDFTDQLRRYRRKKCFQPSLFGRRKQLVEPGMEA